MHEAQQHFDVVAGGNVFDRPAALGVGDSRVPAVGQPIGDAHTLFFARLHAAPHRHLRAGNRSAVLVFHDAADRRALREMEGELFGNRILIGVEFLLFPMGEQRHVAVLVGPEAEDIESARQFHHAWPLESHT